MRSTFGPFGPFGPIGPGEKQCFSYIYEKQVPGDLFPLGTSCWPAQELVVFQKQCFSYIYI